MSKNEIFRTTEHLKELLAEQRELTTEVCKVLFDDEAAIQIWQLPFNGDPNEQIQLLVNIHDSHEIPKCKPDGLATEIWDLLIKKSEINSQSFLLARVHILLSVLLNNKCHFHLFLYGPAGSLIELIQSSMALGSGRELGAAYLRKDSMNSFARLAVAKKLADDPKQKDKASVKELWQDWQKNAPARYKNKSSFAKDMLDKFPNLENQRVISERWCPAWEKENHTLPAQ